MTRFSVVPSRVVEDERFSMTHLRVLLALCTHTDKNGWCFPSRNTMADRVKVSSARISQVTKDLCEWGYIEVTARSRSDGSQTSNGYRVMFDVGQPEDLDGVSVAYGGVNPIELTGGVNPSLTPLTSQVNDSSKKTRGSARGSQLPDGFKANPTHEQMATELQLDLQREVVAFIDFHTSKGSVFKDWDAALRTWLRKARQFKRPRTSDQPTRGRVSKAEQQQKDKEWLDELTGRAKQNTIIDITPA